MGWGILVQKDLDFSPISLDNYCKENDIEVGAVKLKITPIQLIILAIYRSPSCNFSNFLKLFRKLQQKATIRCTITNL